MRCHVGYWGIIRSRSYENSDCSFSVNYEVRLLAQELRQRHRERLGNPDHHKKAWVSLTPLDAPEIRQVNLSIECKLLLRHVALLTQPSNIPPEDRLPIPHLQNGIRSRI